MYNTFKLVTFMVNPQGGESETVEHLTKEVDGQNVPCTREESIVKFYNKLSSMGGSQYVRAIKCMLFDNNGGMIKSDELIKPIEEA